MTKRYVLKPGPEGPDTSEYRIDYEQELNPAQRAAVFHGEGPALVIAGAGSGKTRTLVFRVARMVEDRIPPESILLLTFTRRAAQEMLRRAAAMLDGRCERVRGGTFHSFANAVLRQFGDRIGIDPGFTILDRTDSEDLVQLLRRELELGEKGRPFPKKRTCMELFSACANRVRDLSSLLADEHPHLIEYTDDLVLLYAHYQKHKKEKALLDYDDLLLATQQLLREDLETRERLTLFHRFLMVDEYQDTNTVQAEIVRLLGQDHGNVMVVGDDAQSIYSFRGANFRNIMDFPEQFPGAAVIKLEENYRSTQPLLDFTNRVIDQARERYHKRLFTRQTEGGLPALVPAPTELDQSRFVTQRIVELREEGLDLNRIAVLFRASRDAFDLELELNRVGISYVKYGGLKLMETAHVKDALAYLRVTANPRDTVSWTRLLLLLEGVGPKGARKLIDQVARGKPLLEAAPGAGKRGKLQEQLERLDALFQKLRAPDRPVIQMVEAVLDYYDPILTRKYDDYPKRQRDLEHFLLLAERFPDLEALLTEMVLEPPVASVAGVVPEEPPADRLCLSTIHSAKGLEWEAVFIIWAADGRFPSAYAFHSDEELDEELRLLYVAATRAKTHLYIVYPMTFYDHSAGDVFARPSRFVDGLPQGVLEPWTITEDFPDAQYSQVVHDPAGSDWEH